MEVTKKTGEMVAFIGTISPVFFVKNDKGKWMNICYRTAKKISLAVTDLFIVYKWIPSTP